MLTPLRTWHAVIGMPKYGLLTAISLRNVQTHHASVKHGRLDKRAAESLMKAWPDQVDSIMQDIRRSLDHYYFNRWNMYVGVEYDGYIHT